MSDANERFETLASLYYDRFLDLAPGKDPGMIQRSITMEQNHAQWNDWRMSGEALNDALDKIARLSSEGSNPSSN